MKLRSLILIIATLVVTVTSLSGCVVVPERGYGYYGWHDRGWDHDHWEHDRR